VLGDDGILIPPKKDPKDIAVDELEEIDKLGSNEKADQLWSLACSLAQQTLDDEHPGKTFSTKERYHLYCNYMEQIVLHYADSTHGVELLRYFNSNATKSDWPAYFKNKWNSIRQSCRVDLHKWLKQKNCPLTNDEINKMDEVLKVRTYIGHMIDLNISASESIANNHLNKHWPAHFNSGESPTGLLQMIRRWYYDTIENPRKAANSYKVWAGKNKAIAEKYTEQQKVEDIERRMQKKPFTNKWYPPQWLTWYCYGPPACNMNPAFATVSMGHLTKIKSKTRLDNAEMVTLLGTQSKAVRRSNVSRGANAIVDEGIENLSTSTVSRVHQVNFQRQEPAIDRAIEAAHASIALMESMQTGTISFAAEIEKKKLDLLLYLRKKEEKARMEFDMEK
jgi:hypothetical protein